MLTIILDITNCVAQLPSRQLAEGTYNYRAIGIGHTGIGGVLMRAGIPYENDRSYNIVAAITSLMTAEVYKASAELAAELGPFPRFEANRDNMREILLNHARLSGLDEPADFNKDYFVIDHRKIDCTWSKAIKQSWREVLAADKFRNAFATLIQPSGSVSFIMDCDTQAIEPDYSLIKFKKLIEGGSMKIVNELVPYSLRVLGYTDNQVEDMMVYLLGHGTLKGAPHVSWEEMSHRGVTDNDLQAIEDKLKGVTQLRFAFEVSAESKHHLGIEPKFSGNIFKRLDFTKEQYIESNNWICGHGTLEGAPHLKAEHLPVFDCAMRSGVGSRFITPNGHLNMMRSVAPFVSGAISKTINLPAESTIEDIKEIYTIAYKTGIKCVAIYRDGAKRTQPLNNPSDMSWWEAGERDEVYYRGARKKPPQKRIGLLEEVTINDAGKLYKLWVQFFEYNDGSLCEIWVDISKENPYYKQALKWWAREVSNAIQYGQPLAEITSSFLLEEGGPAGKTDHKYITYCKSIPDFIMKLMSMHYLGDTNWCRIKPPVSELRCRADMSKEILQKPHAATNQLTLTDRCDRCGGVIQAWPCPVCTACGKSFGGCSA